MAIIEIKINKFIDLKNGLITSIEDVGCWEALLELVRNMDNSIYLTSEFEGIVALLYYDFENNDIKARMLKNN